MRPDLFTIDNPTAVQFEVSPEARTIRGLALPFGDVAESGGKLWRFAKGVTSWGKVKVLDGHNWDRAVGTAELTETDDGLVMVAKIARGARGDEVLALAGDGVYDGLSVGLGQNVKATLKDGVHNVTAAPILEVSLTPLPAFERAAVTSVAASAAPNPKESATMDEDEVTTPDFSALTEAINALNATFAGYHAAQEPPVPPRERVPAGDGVQHEEAPYRFDGRQGGQFSLLDDIVASKHGSADAGLRLSTFLGEAFEGLFADTATTDVATLNPAQNRAELYVGPLHFTRPLWNMFGKGGLDSITAFIIPKFGAVTGNPTADHAEGVEPTSFKVSATSQTVTPSPISGKATINREVIDQGGNPKVDQIIWNEMLAHYFEAMEEEIADLLATGTGTEINIGGGANDPAKVKLLLQAFAALQFIRGGDRFSAVAGDPTLYGLLASAQDTAGRPLFPTLGATNADGTKRASLESLQVGPKTIVPAWALDESVANAEVSYMAAPESVHAWLSAPRRFDFEYRVSTVEIGLWGYKAVACTRTSDIVPIDATTSDVA